jgi:hypothetical protein
MGENAAPVVAYICDRKACGETCPSKDGCIHTTDVRHAIGFSEVVPGRFTELAKVIEYDGHQFKSM